MSALSLKLRGALPPTLLTVGMSLLTAWLAREHAGVAAWETIWNRTAHVAMEVLTAVATLLVVRMARPGARLPATAACLAAAALMAGVAGSIQLALTPLAGSGQAGLPDGGAFWLVARGGATLALLAALLAPPALALARRAWIPGMLGLAVLGALAWSLAPASAGVAYGLVAADAGAVLVLLLRARRGGPRAARRLALAAALLGVSEINVILAPIFGDVFGIAAHVYAILACLYLYRALAPRPCVMAALDDLPDRYHMLEVVARAIALARPHGGATVLVLGINAFRKINSSYGWASGDQVVRECVARIADRIGPNATLAHRGGNEFFVVLVESDRTAAAQLAQTLLESMHTPFQLGQQRAFLSASVGIAVLPDADCTASQLVQMAQMAMACARADGQGHPRFYSADMEQTIQDRINLETQLCQALERNQFVLQYQPRVNLSSGLIVGAEALVRWRHPQLGLVPPTRFIPLAEETGMIGGIDLWVLREACTCAAAWHAAQLPLGRISVNLSAQQFQHPGLAQRVCAILDDTGLAPGSLELEITESTVMHDTGNAAAVLDSLRTLGVKVSIDDFGTGYSSLSYLKRFPIDVLKIDRSFMEDVVANPTGAAIIRTIIALAHSLGLSAVAEGVETAEQMAFLKDNGCDEIQGYYFSRPVWPEQLRQLLAQEAPVAA